MSRNQNPFEPQQLDSNPFEPHDTANPFDHPNDSAFSLGSNDTERPGQGAKPTRGPGYGGARDAELDARIAAVEARERAVREREDAVKSRENNWPPFFPFIHHAPNELPEDHRRVGQLLYTQWLALALTLIINMVASIFTVAGLIAAVIYVPFIGAASFFAWYRPIYLGLERTEGKAMAFFFYTYFIFAGFHWLFSCYMLMGFPATGAAGIVTTMSSFMSHRIVGGVLATISSVGWAVQVFLGGFLYKKIYNFKKGNGDITFASAQDTFKHTAIKNILLHQARV